MYEHKSNLLYLTYIQRSIREVQTILEVFEGKNADRTRLLESVNVLQYIGTIIIYQCANIGMWNTPIKERHINRCSS